MNRTTLAISAGAATTIMMLAFLTLTGDDAEAQTGNPKQAVALKMYAPLECGKIYLVSSMENHHNTVIETFDSAWRS